MLQPVEAPIRQPVDTLLAGYAAGTLNAPLHALVASHLDLSPANRPFVAALEQLAAGALADAAPLALEGQPAMLDAILADAPEAVRLVTLEAVDPVFPRALQRLVGSSSHEIAWRFKLPGIKEYRIADTDAGEAVLYWVKAGRRLPRHTHEGEEVTLLLKGGFTDPLGHYRRGDLAIADMELDHTPVADIDEDCICFAVTDAPLQLTGPVMRVLQRVFRH